MAGKLFEEFTVGQVFQHEPGRTITEADNVFFTCLTMNPQPLHLDFEAASKAEFGKPLVNSLLTLGIAVGSDADPKPLGFSEKGGPVEFVEIGVERVFTLDTHR